MKRKLSLYITAIIISGTLLLSACTQPDEEPSHYTIGLITNNANGLNNVQGFIDGMAELGYIEGENVSYIFAGEPVPADELESALQEMVDAEVDLIFTAGTPTGVAAYQVTEGTEIPVVFGVIADPVAAGVMDSLVQPGGNMTGIMLSANQSRRLELFLEIAPIVKRIFIAYNPDDTAPVSALEQVETRAADLDVEVISHQARNEEEVIALLDNMPQDIDAIFLLPDSVINAHQKEFLDYAIEHDMPSSGPTMIQVEDGALMAYGIIHHLTGAHAAQIANRILKGGDPAFIPVETAEFYLGINLQTAKKIGLEVPYDILQQARFVIRGVE